MTQHTFGILFQKKLGRANPFLPFERKSLLTLIVNVNVPVNRLLLVDYVTNLFNTISYIL